ncbi:MAG: hypothetical protein A3J97_03850 [Spirochaetes bacterium RIFOXYC1_FULL_54_7]|nr:MAG: hypothetical protein A3J97_03850 [Spirochaetes bacterium RIFOXYC1_FULL_54_7]
MASYRLPHLPDRQAVLHFIVIMKPWAGRIIGALSGMTLAGPFWLYGLCVGILLGYMVDTVRAKATTSGSTTSGSTAGNGTAGNKAEQAHTHSQIPEESEETDPYQRLGLLPGASVTEVKKAWRIRSRQAHPDAPGGEAEDFMALKSAYEQIMDKRKTDPAGH